MGRFSHITRASNPANTRRTQWFVLALVLVLVLGVVYRGAQVATRMDTFIAQNLVEDHPQDHVASLELLPANQTAHLDASVSASTSQDTQRLQTTDSEQSTHPKTHEHGTGDPCVGRPQPAPIPADSTKPPSLYFLHIPKTAGTLMHHLLILYANKTNGLACQYLYDGNRFGPHDYHLSVQPPPPFPSGSIEEEAVVAIIQRNIVKKLQVLKKGACRAVRGHITYKLRDFMQPPVISLTVLRDPLERFVSMYEFAWMMVRSRPGKTGWDNLISGDLAADFKNSSSILSRGFYDADGRWIATGNVGFSFHFYGVLHQLSGLNPTFEGVGIPEQFRISNADELAEKAKDNICSTHILGTQGNMDATLDLFFKTTSRYSNWTDAEIKIGKTSVVNKNLQKKKEAGENWPDSMREVMQKRFQHETDVYNFALKVIEYRRHSQGNNETGSPSS